MRSTGPMPPEHPPSPGRSMLYTPVEDRLRQRVDTLYDKIEALEKRIEKLERRNRRLYGRMKELRRSRDMWKNRRMRG